MTSEEFTTWLKGYLAAIETDGLTKEQLSKVKKELMSVYKSFTITSVNGFPDNSLGGAGFVATGMTC